VILPDGFTIATSRYQSQNLIIESGLAPVRITLGRPRMQLRYELAGELPELAPPRSLFRVNDRQKFELPYRRHLDRHVDVRALGDRFVAIAGAVGAPGVVLLCFEDVTRPGEWCHRRVFADWWRAGTGMTVSELGV
jgi:hypothetical protein